MQPWSSAVPHELLLAFSTAPDKATAERIAEVLVEEGLVACVNLVPGLLSVYRWQGAVQREGEVLLVMKTQAPRMPRLKERLSAVHPYEVPELIAIPVRDGLEAYCRWVAEESTGSNHDISS
jgi:periplasmic divalent cation tolerance protein